LRVEIYIKPQCPLCEEAKDVLADAARRVRFELIEINILTDPLLYDRYRYEIPVIRVGEETLFRHRVDEDALVEALLRRGGTPVAESGSAD
jgi:hypothetical protein